MRVFAVALSIVLGASISAPASAQGLPELSNGYEVPIGRSAAGEACRARLVDQATAPVAFQSFNIHCEGWEQRSGTIIRTLGVGRSLAWWLSESAWKQGRRETLDCTEATKALTLADNTAALSQQCTLRAGGWPTVLMVAQRNGRTYYGQAIPAVLPLLEEGIFILEGQRKAPEDRTQTVNAALRFVEAELGAAATKFGARDMRSYDVFFRLGVAANQAEEFAREEDAFRQALGVQEKLFGANPPSGMRATYWMANAISKQGRYDEATPLYGRVSAFFARGGNAASLDLVEFLAFRGRHEARTGRNDAAAASLSEAVRMGRELAASLRSPAALIHPLFQASNGFTVLGRHADAVRAGQEAVRVAESSRGMYHPNTRFSYQALAGAYRGAQQPEEALKASRRALEISTLLYGDAPVTARDHAEIGAAERAAGRAEAALAAYRRGGAIMRKNLGHPQASQFAAGGYLTALVEAGGGGVVGGANAAEAFEVAQLARSGTVARAVTLMSARLAAGDQRLGGLSREHQDAIAARQEARGDLAEEMSKTPDKRDANRQRELEKAVEAAEAKVGKLEEQMIAGFPRYAGLTLPKVVTAEEAGRLLAADEAVVQIVDRGNATHVSLATRGAFAVHTATLPSAEIARLVGSLRASVDWADGAAKAFPLADAHALYAALLAPVADRLASVRHLYVVAGGPLASLPLGLLVTTPTAGDDYRSAPWLARKFSVSVLPSVRNLADLRRARAATAAPEAFLGVGNPTLGQNRDRAGIQRFADTCLAGERVDRRLIDAMPALPETEQELRKIAATLGAPSNVVVGAEATKAKLRGRDLSRFRVLSFATHGVLPAELRCNNEPGLVLTPGTGADDGFLRASEISTLRMNADFVVLSACNTAGPGGKFGGEALAGLAQSFIYAGARALLASHWAVASEPTVALTTGLFEGWKANQQAGRAAALKTVQEKLIAGGQTAHPAFWAAFVLVGDRT